MEEALAEGLMPDAGVEAVLPNRAGGDDGQRSAPLVDERREVGGGAGLRPAVDARRGGEGLLKSEGRGEPATEERVEEGEEEEE